MNVTTHNASALELIIPRTKTTQANSENYHNIRLVHHLRYLKQDRLPGVMCHDLNSVTHWYTPRQITTGMWSRSPIDQDWNLVSHYTQTETTIWYTLWYFTEWESDDRIRSQYHLCFGDSHHVDTTFPLLLQNDGSIGIEIASLVNPFCLLMTSVNLEDF